VDSNLIQTILIYALPVIFAITVHEAAHGYVARHFGDHTAEVMGRVTPHPMKHIHPIRTLLMPLMLYFATSGAFLFGYAKPVPVDFGRLHHPKRDMIWVALAGPMSNFIQALLWTLVWASLKLLDIDEEFFREMAEAGIRVNLVMCALNLFPLPPLDGGRVLAGLLPNGPAQNFLARIEPFGFFIVMGLIIARILDTFWMRPLMTLGYDFINLLLSPLR